MGLAPAASGMAVSKVHFAVHESLSQHPDAPVSVLGIMDDLTIL